MALLDKNITKDGVGEEVKVGDTVAYAYTIGGAMYFSKGAVVSIGKTGRVTCKGTGSKKNFIKIFNQDG